MSDKSTNLNNISANKMELHDINDDDDQVPEFYDWVMIPNCNSDEKKTGVTFKGDSEEYLIATDLIFKLLNQKGLNLCINDRNLRIADNPKNKNIKVEIKPLKGPTGKVNV